jgi:hypothetical protein
VTADAPGVCKLCKGAHFSVHCSNDKAKVFLGPTLDNRDRAVDRFKNLHKSVTTPPPKGTEKSLKPNFRKKQLTIRPKAHDLSVQTKAMVENWEDSLSEVASDMEVDEDI